ncbi:MAG TPA: MmcQ/YjbR family DNA-binding protein [Bacillota bacterium]|nr:MmcQ/YjbR family DNA-binding protein [Bacillota bacterium]
MNKYEWLDSYLLTKQGCLKDYKEEWGWWRYQVGEKLFAATCTPGPTHQGYDCRELLTLKCDPLMAEALRADHEDIIPGFYMNKQNWISVFLDGSLPDDMLRQLIDHSYELVLHKLTKKLQKEISEL